jgi:hypothetical protein
MSLNKKIEQYTNHFRGHMPQIRSIPEVLYRKILYVTLLDCLSRAAFPETKYNRDRFIKFIENFGNWTDKDRISTPQLVLLLNKNSLAGGRLYRKVSRHLKKWPDARVIRPNSDFHVNELYDLAESNEILYIENAKYLRLLYIYRNHLVHEFREPGYGMDFSDDDSSPYYFSMLSLELVEQEPTWELVFPCSFLHELCSKSVEGLERHLKSQGINPYDSYQFGTLWASGR